MKTILFDKDSSLDEIRKYVGQTPTRLGQEGSLRAESGETSFPVDNVRVCPKWGVTFDPQGYSLFDTWVIEFEELDGDPAPEISPGVESLADRKARLERELAEVNAESARDGAPEGCNWGPHTQGGTSLLQGCLDVCAPFRGCAISWDDGGHAVVYLRNAKNYLVIDAKMVFAWVDRVRANGETDL